MNRKDTIRRIYNYIESKKDAEDNVGIPIELWAEAKKSEEKRSELERLLSRSVPDRYSMYLETPHHGKNSRTVL